MFDYANAIPMTLDEFAAAYAPSVDIQVIRFLADRETREKRFEFNRRDAYHFIKSRFDAETELIYGEWINPRVNGRELNGDLRYYGIYSHKFNALFAAEDVLYDFCGEENRCAAVLERFYDAVDAQIESIIGGKPLPIDGEMSEFEKRDREHFEKHGAKEYAERRFLEDNFSDNIMRYQPPRNMLPTREAFIRALHNTQEAAREYAESYILQNARKINLYRWQNELINRRYAEIEKNPGELLTRKTIAAAIPAECKTVRVEISKNGAAMSAKMEARPLRCVVRNYYSTYDMDAQSRAEFEKLYGRAESLYSTDIVSIKHGGKVLYQA